MTTPLPVPSDQDETVCPVVAAFCRAWKDAPNAHVERTRRLLLPFAARIIGTATGTEDSETRAWMATDWLARACAPAWLRLAGLADHAAALEATARIADTATASAARPLIAAAAAAARALAWDAARDAARALARAAAWDAAGDAAGGAAWDAARAPAWDAARDAAGDALRPTVEALHLSACDLLGRMCDVGRAS